MMSRTSDFDEEISVLSVISVVKLVDPRMLRFGHNDEAEERKETQQHGEFKRL